MFAISAPGLERILRSELDQAGVSDAEVIEGGVTFNGDISSLYKSESLASDCEPGSCASCGVSRRHVSRAGKAREANQMGRTSEARLSRAVSRDMQKSRLYHSDAVAERFADAIVRQVGAVDIAPAGPEASEDADHSLAADPPSQLFIVRLTHDNCVVSVDSSGPLLHRVVGIVWPPKGAGPGNAGGGGW
jgi:putative N6-adenine-specific DNA methylase